MNHVVYATLITEKNESEEKDPLLPVDIKERTMTFESDDVLYMFENDADGKACCQILFRTDHTVLVTESLRIMHRRVYGTTMPEPKENKANEQK